MLDIEIIKWGCQFADGFEYNMDSYRKLTCVYGKSAYFDWCSITKNITHGEDQYSLFLQRVIEGINIESLNNHNFNFCIVQHHTGILIKETFEYEDLLWLKALNDQAKEQAIKYIYKELEDAR